MLIGCLLSSMLIETPRVLSLVNFFRVCIGVRVRVVKRVIDVVLMVLIGPIILMTLVELRMSLVVACIFVKAVIVLLLIVVRV